MDAGSGIAMAWACTMLLIDAVYTWCLAGLVLPVHAPARAWHDARGMT